MENDSTGKIKRFLRVDLDTLQSALDNTSYSISHYLDLETGEVMTVQSDAEQEWEALYSEWESTGRASDIETFMEEAGMPDWMVENTRDAARIEDGYGSRYVPVPHVDSGEGYRDMDDFVDTVRDELLRRRLRQALDGKRPFRRFKDTLFGFPQERERWFSFKDERLAQRAFDWLEALGITAIVSDDASEE